MKTLVKQFLVFFVALFILSGCATGTKFTEFMPSIQKPPNTGRIYFYRSTSLGLLVQPNVTLNGEVVGEAIPYGFFYVDRTPGLYEISIKTEVDRTRSFILDQGQIVYVRIMILPGIFIAQVYPDLVDPEIGAKEIKDCRYTGQKE